MAQDAFHFKQFVVEQEECAMKVCTDACLFGAMIRTADHNRILDIGAGTGVISLMVAQRTATPIDAVEVKEETVEQCRGNFARSNWHERLTSYHADIESFAHDATTRYDLIMSNPPFFRGQLRSQYRDKSIAKHDNHLSHSKLLKAVSQLLTPSHGHFWVILPPDEAEQFSTQAIFHGLYQAEIIDIIRKAGKPAKRRVMEFLPRQDVLPRHESFYICNAENQYSQQFCDLMQPYYNYL